MTKPGLSGEKNPPKYQKENNSQSIHTGIIKISSFFFLENAPF